MPAVTDRDAPTRYEIAAWILTAAALLLVLKLRLIGALFAGLLVHQLVHMLVPVLTVWRVRQDRGRLIAVALLSTVIVTLLTLLIIGLVSFFRSDVGNLPALMRRMADIIEASRASLPGWMTERLPATAEETNAAIALWFREHTGMFQVLGTETARALAHILIGMVIGALVALRGTQPSESPNPLARALTERAARIASSFRRVVFAQIRISFVNTVFTGIYLMVVLPAMGVHLQFAKTMVVITFIVGLLPVIGNLISNTVIVVVSLSHSPYVAIASLTFLVVIHKLEYFLNARIIGTQIQARAWELLTAMLLMEAAFGLAGVIAAPIYYAYVKDELKNRRLI